MSTRSIEPAPPPPVAAMKRIRRGILIAGANGVVLAAAAGGLVWAVSSARETASPVAEHVPAAPRPAVLSPAASSGYVPRTIYIVGSPEQAASVYAGINEANAIRASANEPPMLDEVVVATSAQRAAAIAAAEAEANTILATMFGVENRVVDLRS